MEKQNFKNNISGRTLRTKGDNFATTDARLVQSLMDTLSKTDDFFFIIAEMILQRPNSDEVTFGSPVLTSDSNHQIDP